MTTGRINQIAILLSGTLHAKAQTVPER